MVALAHFSTFTWDTNWWDAALRMLVAIVCAGLIGWDREAKGHPAGLRTHMLVALGSAAFALIACELFEVLDDTDQQLFADPARILGAIVGGVGFLGAGAIMHTERGSVRGLTTAAGLWVAAAIGMASGVGYWPAAILVTAFALIILVALKWAQRRGIPSETAE